jgi:hypothetical protein
MFRIVQLNIPVEHRRSCCTGHVGSANSPCRTAIMSDSQHNRRYYSLLGHPTTPLVADLNRWIGSMVSCDQQGLRFGEQQRHPRL